jgi:hypothetical protein
MKPLIRGSKFRERNVEPSFETWVCRKRSSFTHVIATFCSKISLNIYLNYIQANSSVGIATGWKASVRLSAGPRDFSLLHSVRNGSRAHSASHSMGTGGSFPRGKATGT